MFCLIITCIKLINWMGGSKQSSAFSTSMLAVLLRHRLPLFACLLRFSAIVQQIQFTNTNLQFNRICCSACVWLRAKIYYSRSCLGQPQDGEAQLVVQSTAAARFGVANNGPFNDHKVTLILRAPNKLWILCLVYLGQSFKALLVVVVICFKIRFKTAIIWYRFSVRCAY